MKKHTREPWYLQPEPWPPSIRTGPRGYEIAIAKSPYTASDYREEERANAERIVDCVNACTGMANPVMELAWLRRAAWLGYELSRYAAASKLRNTPEYLEGMKEECAAVQEAYLKCQGEAAAGTAILAPEPKQAASANRVSSELQEKVKELAEELQQERDRANKAAEYAEGCNKVMKLACGVVWLMERVKANPQTVGERGDALQLDSMMRALKADEYGAAEMERITKRGAPAWPLKDS
jgi:hypothetical protein